jgi:hypothetical protein
MSGSLARLLAERRGWSAERIALFDAGFRLYWERGTELARRTRRWPPPRLRHVAVVADPLAVRPYAQILNTTSWTLYDCDLDPSVSHPELVAYLLVHGDRLAVLGEVTLAALHDAAYWFERDQADRAAFAAAAERSTRPDAAAFRALARAGEWLRELADETLRAPSQGSVHRSIPGTGLLVPAAIDKEPQLLVDLWRGVARGALAAFHDRWRRPDPRAVAELTDWLAAREPAVLIVGRDGKTLWDPAAGKHIGALRSALREASGAAVRDVAADLRRIDEVSRAFLAACVAPDDLAAPPSEMESGGYTFFGAARRILAYDLVDPALERLRGPSLPYARAMLGARALHEWSHLAAAAGWVPRKLADAETAALLGELATVLDEAIADAPADVRRRTDDDLRLLLDTDRGARPLHRRDDRRLLAAASAGAALARSLLTRMPDYQANLLAARFWTGDEAEAYVRHNVRTLRGHYRPGQMWRMLVRYLYEYQYLRFSAVEDGRRYFLSTTWFAPDFDATRIFDESKLDLAASLVASICAGYAVDESRFSFPARPEPHFS